MRSSAGKIQLRIEKYDSSNNQVLADITFRVWRDGELLGDYRTNELGEIVLTDLTPAPIWSRKWPQTMSMSWTVRPSR